jgi:hypothetical protein
VSDPTDILLRSAPSAPSLIFGVVTQASPLRIRVDGDTDALPHSPPSLAPALALNDRVALMRSGTVLLIVGVVGGCPHAVGDLWSTTSATAPATRWPNTTWEAYAAGKVLVGKAATGTFATAGATMGHEALAVHSHSTTAPYTTGAGTTHAGTGIPPHNNVQDAHNWSVASDTAGTGDSGNIQPSIVVYIWRRTA